MTKSLNDSDMLTTRRAAIRSFAAKTGLAAAIVASGVALASSPAAAASDKRNQTDTDTGRASDDVAQTDTD